MYHSGWQFPKLQISGRDNEVSDVFSSAASHPIKVLYKGLMFEQEEASPLESLHHSFLLQQCLIRFCSLKSDAFACLHCREDI